MESDIHIFAADDGDSNLEMILQSKGSNNDVSIHFYEGEAGAMSIWYDGENNELNFRDLTQSSTRVTFERDGNVGIGTRDPYELLHVDGLVRLDTDTGGTFDVCQNSYGNLSVCSSSQRYKKDVSSLDLGMATVEKLNPVTFKWKQGGLDDLGFIAEEVREVAPILVTYNDQAEPEGVKYKQLTAVLVNAVKELNKENYNLRNQLKQQQSQLVEQHKKIDRLFSMLDAGDLISYRISAP